MEGLVVAVSSFFTRQRSDIMRLVRLRHLVDGVMHPIVCERAGTQRVEAIRKAWGGRRPCEVVREGLRGPIREARRSRLTALIMRVICTIEGATTVAVPSAVTDFAVKVCLMTAVLVGRSRVSWSTERATKSLPGRVQTTFVLSKEVVFAIGHCRNHEVPHRPTFGGRRVADVQLIRLVRISQDLQTKGRARQARSRTA